VAAWGCLALGWVGDPLAADFTDTRSGVPHALGVRDGGARALRHGAGGAGGLHGVRWDASGPLEAGGAVDGGGDAGVLAYEPSDLRIVGRTVLPVARDLDEDVSITG